MILVPDYYKKFKCIADKCTDSCCIGWEIDVDEKTLVKYRALGSRGDEILSHVESASPPYIRLSSGGRCPFLDERGLCRIISGLGEEYIPDICKNHPRYINELSSIREIGLGLACPEAARIILSTTAAPRLEKSDESPTNDDVSEIKRDKFPTNEEKRENVRKNIPTFSEKSKNALFSLRESLFELVFDENYSVFDIASALLNYDKLLLEWAFDAQIGEFYPLPELEIGTGGEIYPLITPLSEAISSVELLREEYRCGFATPTEELVRERLCALGPRARALLYYFIHRYFLAEAESLDITLRLSLSVMLLSMLALHTDDADIVSSAVEFSKNIEYSTENIEILLSIIAEGY